MTDPRVEAVSTGSPAVLLLACVRCGVLVWDIDAHYQHAHGCGHPNHGNEDHDCRPFTAPEAREGHSNV